MNKQESNYIEALAELEHQQWAHWTRYMLDNLSPENAQKWRKQIDTPYTELSEQEKESDREWAHKVIELLKEHQALRTDLEEELPYQIMIQRAYNPYYGDHRTCVCEHPYHRHFDSHNGMEIVGCKYSGCCSFQEKEHDI